MSHLYASSAAYLCGNFQLSFSTRAVKYAVFALFYFLRINTHCILRQLFTNALFHFFFFYTCLNVASVLNLKFSCVARSPSILMLTKLQMGSTLRSFRVGFLVDLFILLFSLSPKHSLIIDHRYCLLLIFMTLSLYRSCQFQVIVDKQDFNRLISRACIESYLYLDLGLIACNYMCGMFG